MDTAGDGFLATFDGPARAIRSAYAIAERVQALALEVRIGLHTGEVELVQSYVRGIAVHIGARTAALAGPGEVLVTSTVKDLVAGSGIEFEDRGARAKGCAGEVAHLPRYLGMKRPRGRRGDEESRVARAVRKPDQIWVEPNHARQ